MAIKLQRFFAGGYVPNYEKLLERGAAIIRTPKPLIVAVGSNQGFGLIKGTVKKLGNAYFPVQVCCFVRSSRQLLWETTSKPDGSYFFRNVAPGMEFFIVAFDPNNEYNAVISDKVIAK